MEVIVTKQFDKDVNKELSKAMQYKLALLIEELQQAVSLDAITNVKKLKGYKIELYHLLKFSLLSDKINKELDNKPAQ